MNLELQRGKHSVVNNSQSHSLEPMMSLLTSGISLCGFPQLYLHIGMIHSKTDVSPVLE